MVYWQQERINYTSGFSTLKDRMLRSGMCQNKCVSMLGCLMYICDAGHEAKLAQPWTKISWPSVYSQATKAGLSNYFSETESDSGREAFRSDLREIGSLPDFKACISFQRNRWDRHSEPISCTCLPHLSFVRISQSYQGEKVVEKRILLNWHLVLADQVEFTVEAWTWSYLIIDIIQYGSGKKCWQKGFSHLDRLNDSKPHVICVDLAGLLATTLQEAAISTAKDAYLSSSHTDTILGTPERTQATAVADRITDLEQPHPASSMEKSAKGTSQVTSGKINTPSNLNEDAGGSVIDTQYNTKNYSSWQSNRV